MVQIWVHDNIDGEPRSPHKDTSDKEELTVNHLKEFGILYWKLNADENDPTLQRLRTEEGYSYSDVITINPEKRPDYEPKTNKVYEEHMHSDAEIRYFLEGSAYFDVRNKDDKWVRIHAERGDLIALPARIYHRFTIDKNKYAKIMRLFAGEPVWTPINRPADDHPARQGYVKQFLEASV